MNFDGGEANGRKRCRDSLLYAGGTRMHMAERKRFIMQKGVLESPRVDIL